MLDIEFIRQNTQDVKEAVEKRGLEVDVKQLLALDEQRRELLQQVEELRAQRNELSTQQSGQRPDQQAITQAREIKGQLENIEPKLDRVEEDYHALMLQVPNVVAEDVPVGDEEAGQVVKTVGEPADFSFKPKPHWELATDNDLLDLETAAVTSGSRFYYLKNGAVTLEFALVRWIQNKLADKGFTLVTTPQLVREDMMVATGFFPAERHEIYSVNPDDDGLYLIGTSEVPLAGLHMDQTLSAEAVPKRYAGFSTCFRREAGSWGKDTRGIFRVHQFDKVEMYSFVDPSQSAAEHEFLLGIEEEILQELELPYQVVNIASGDLGVSAVKKYDCEVWIPSQQRYRELTSCSNTTDFQARRANIKIATGDDTALAHTLNGTAMASTRTLVAIMENYQTKDGKISVPKVLQPYMPGEYL